MIQSAGQRNAPNGNLDVASMFCPRRCDIMTARRAAQVGSAQPPSSVTNLPRQFDRIAFGLPPKAGTGCTINWGDRSACMRAILQPSSRLHCTCEVRSGSKPESAPFGLCQLPPAPDIRAYWLRTATGALDGKTKHLIGLAVAPQIPCAYCV